MVRLSETFSGMFCESIFRLQIERQTAEADCWREKYRGLESSLNAKMETLER